MSEMDSLRCHDCLAELGGGPRYGVLKRMRDAPAPLDDPREARMLESMCFDPVPVCEDCAAWYGDEAMLVVAALSTPREAQS